MTREPKLRLVVVLVGFLAVVFAVVVAVVVVELAGLVVLVRLDGGDAVVAADARVVVVRW